MRIALLLFLVACGASSSAPTPPPTVTAPPPAHAIDACQRAFASNLQTATLPVEIFLVSAPGAEAEAAPYDAWLRVLPSTIAYQWITIDDDVARRFARRAGLIDARIGLVIESGVALESVRLNGADANNLVRKPNGDARDDCHLPAAASDRKPGHFTMPRKPLVAKGTLARATALRIDEPGRHAELERSGTTWKLRTNAGAFDADSENVEHVLANLEEVELFEPLAKDAAHDAVFGLAPDVATHVVVTSGTDTLVDFAFGRSGARGAAVRVSGDSETRIASGISEYLFHRETKFWRNRTILNFDAAAVDRIELDAQHHWVFTRERDTWRATLDGRPFTPLAEESVPMLISAFRKLSAEDFAEAGAATGLDKTAHVIRFVVHGERKVLRVGGLTPVGGGFFAQVDGDPIVYVISGYPAAWVNGAEPERFRKKS